MHAGCCRSISDRSAAPMKYLTRKQATAYLRENGITVSDSYLGWGARVGTGPQFRYLGKHPVYTKRDLSAWSEARKAGALEAFLQRTRLRPGPPHTHSPALSSPGPAPQTHSLGSLSSALIDWEGWPTVESVGRSRS